MEFWPESDGRLDVGDRLSRIFDMALSILLSTRALSATTIRNAETEIMPNPIPPWTIQAITDSHSAGRDDANSDRLMIRTARPIAKPIRARVSRMVVEIGMKE